MAARDVADQLYARIYADPTDVEARAVLADVLQELGDPRGLLIATQLTGRAPDLAKEIVRKNVRQLLGPLAGVVLPETAVFENGFLDACGVHAEKDDQAARTLRCVEWATVRTISLYTPRLGAWHTDPIPLLTSPAMRSLRAVEYLHGDDVIRITTPIPLTRLRLTVLRQIQSMERASAMFPDLVELHCGKAILGPYPRQITAFLRLPLVRRVKRLSMIAEYYNAEMVTAVHRADAELAAETVVIDRSGTGWSWTLSRGADGRLSRLDGDFETYAWAPLEEMTAIAQAIGPGLRAIHVRSQTMIGDEPAAQRDAFAAVRAAAPSAKCTFDIPS